jgi:uncharacterized phage infection (PIP) family protein YhgE
VTTSSYGIYGGSYFLRSVTTFDFQGLTTAISNELNNIKAQLKQQTEQNTQLEKDKSSLKTQLQEITSQLSLTQSNLNQANELIESLKKTVKQKDSEIDAIAEKMKQQQNNTNSSLQNNPERNFNLIKSVEVQPRDRTSWFKLMTAKVQSQMEVLDGLLLKLEVVNPAKFIQIKTDFTLELESSVNQQFRVVLDCSQKEIELITQEKTDEQLKKFLWIEKAKTDLMNLKVTEEMINQCLKPIQELASSFDVLMTQLKDFTRSITEARKSYFG